MLVEQGEAQVWDFAQSEVPGASDRDLTYWRDVGTLDAYYEAHMDLVAVEPMFNLYNQEWPILTAHEALPPAKFVFEDGNRTGRAMDSMVCAGVVVSGGCVRNSILSPGVRVHEHAEVHSSVLLQGVEVGRHALVRHAIVDKNVLIPDGAQIGVDLVRDRERFTVSPSGVVVIGKGERVEA
jgi:glucose-1-phosphate adenylyltransferase